MKLFIFLTVFFISLSGACDEVKEGIDINIKLLMCLDEKVPNSTIKDPENRTAKSLFLFPSIIENVMETKSDDESKNLFALSTKYCGKEIRAFEAFIEKQTKEQNKKDYK